MVDIWPIIYIALIVILIFAGIKLFESIIKALVFAAIVGLVFFSIAYIDLVRKINSFKPSSILIAYSNSKVLGGFILINKENLKVAKFLNSSDLSYLNEKFEEFLSKNNISLALIYKKEGLEDVVRGISLEVKTSNNNVLKVDLSKEEVLDLLYSEDAKKYLEDLLKEKYNATIDLNLTSEELKSKVFFELNYNVISEEEILGKIISLSKEDKIKVYPEFWWLKVMKFLPIKPVVTFYYKIVKFAKDIISEVKEK